MHRSLQSGQALVDGVRVRLQLWLTQANKGHFHLNPRGGAALDLYQSRLKQVQPTENLGQGKLPGARLNMLVFVIGTDDQLAAFLHRFDHHKVAEVIDHLHAQPFHIIAVLMELSQLLHSGAAVPGQYGVRQAIKCLAPGQTGHFADQLGSNLLAAPGALIQNGQAVSQGTVCNAGDQGGSIRRQFHALQSGYLLQAHRHGLRLNTLKVKALAPAENGGRQLVHLCGG